MAQTESVPRFRFKHEGEVSPWMTGDQLKQAAMLGQVPPESLVQPAGRSEWVPATTVRGLEFPAPKEAENVELHPHFNTLKDLLGRFVHSSVQINLIDEHHFDEAELLMCSEDHFEVSLPRRKMQAFVPYNRIKAIATVETEPEPDSDGKHFRDTHNVRIEVEMARLFTASGD